METNDLLREIADEFHNLNLNIVELINVLKNNGSARDDKVNNELEMLIGAMMAHDSQLEAKQAEATPAVDPADSEYQRRQANFDQALKKLGIMT